MNLQKTEKIKQLFNENNGIMKTAELRKNGISSRNIKEMLDKGFLSKIKQGHYIWDNKINSTTDIEILSKIVPNGVLCLFTAIEHYELSTINPTEICLALPRNVTCPVLPVGLCVKIYYMTDKHFTLGITETNINGIKVKIYDIEKTICDCFKYDRDIEKAVALEVLKNYISRGNCNVQKLLEYAKIIGKKRIILPYLEALL